jgi:hypothetical protein
MPLRTFTVTGTPRAPRGPRAHQRAISRGFTGDGAAAAVACHLGDGAAEVHVEMIDPCSASARAMVSTSAGSLP